uniref:Uncharacterized protein n=1 Tax=Zea mays TaxID=4577 RepID=C0P623_MAIZE|nr:unknown [Zea mays]
MLVACGVCRVPACLGRQLLHGHLLHLLVRPGLHLAAEAAGPAEHGAVPVGVRVRVPHSGDGDGLTRDDDGVDHLPLRVVHGEHVEAAAADLVWVDDGVQEGARAVRAAHHQRGAGRHVPPEVLHHARLLLGRHAHERRQEDDVVGGQAPRDVGHVGGAERHARGERGVGAHEAARPAVGLRADVVVVEGGGGEVARGEHEGAERERAGPHEGDAGGRRARDVARQQAVLQLAQQQVVAEVGEERQVVQRAVQGRQQVRVVRLQLGLGVGAAADEARAHALQLRAQAFHVHGAARDAGRDEVREQRVHLRRRAQRRQLRDGGGQAGDLAHQRGLRLILQRQHLDGSYFMYVFHLHLLLLLLIVIVLAHDDHERVVCDHSRSQRLLLRFGVGEVY